LQVPTAAPSLNWVVRAQDVRPFARDLVRGPNSVASVSAGVVAREVLTLHQRFRTPSNLVKLYEIDRPDFFRALSHTIERRKKLTFDLLERFHPTKRRTQRENRISPAENRRGSFTGITHHEHAPG
jgi:hypothetical protein